MFNASLVETQYFASKNNISIQVETQNIASLLVQVVGIYNLVFTVDWAVVFTCTVILSFGLHSK